MSGIQVSAQKKGGVCGGWGADGQVPLTATESPESPI